MPTYDYFCKKCGSSTSVFCKISERDSKVPECHGPMERQITNNQRHVDNTEWRKGHYNSKEGYHR